MSKSRTTADIMSGLLDIILEDVEWRGRYVSCPRRCCLDWTCDCEYCSAEEERGHKPNCGLGSIIKEAVAFIEGEKDLSNEEETI